MRQQAAAWSSELAGLKEPDLTLAQLELFVGKCVTGRLGKAAHPKKNSTLIGECGYTLFDFRGPIDAWIAALRDSEKLRTSPVDRQDLLKKMIAAHLNRTRGTGPNLPPPGPVLEPANAFPSPFLAAGSYPESNRKILDKKVPAGRFAMHTDQPTRRTILLDTETGEAWALEGMRWAPIARG